MKKKGLLEKIENGWQLTITPTKVYRLNPPGVKIACRDSIPIPKEVAKELMNHAGVGLTVVS